MPVFTIRTTAQAMISEIWRVEADDETDARNMLADGSADFVAQSVVGDETDRDVEEVEHDGGAMAAAFAADERAKDEAPAMLAALRRFIAWDDAGCDPSRKCLAEGRAILARIDGTPTGEPAAPTAQPAGDLCQVPRHHLAALMGAAGAYADDLASGLEDGTYDNAAERDAVRAALEACADPTAQPAPAHATITAFCQDASGEGTIWIDAVYPAAAGGEIDAGVIRAARKLAREACADDWGRDSAEDVHCLGLIAGNVRVLDWQDIRDADGGECQTCAEAVETRAAPCDECGAMDGEA